LLSTLIGLCMSTAPLKFREEELLADVIARLIGDVRHVAVGNASPIPATAALLARERGAGRPYVSLLQSRKHNFFTDGARELFDCAGQGRIDVFFLSGGQIDGQGNVNLVSTGDYARPKVRFPGSFGSAYLYYVVPKVILFRTEHSRRTLVPKVDFISAPGSSNPNVFRPGGPIALVGTITILAVAQVGSLFSADAWNNVTFTAGEVRNPQRNLPLSLAIGTGVVIFLYVMANVVYLTALPLVGDANGTTLVARGIQHASEDRVATAVMEQIFSSGGAKIMAVLILISGFGCNNGLILAGARVYYAMAKDGLFFKGAAKLHPKYHTPAHSLLMQCVWTCILCISGSYGQLLDYIIFAVLVFYILTIAGLFVLRVKRPDAPRPYRAIGYPVLPAIYILMAVFIDIVLLRYKPQYTWPGLFIVLLGIPVYYLWSRQNRSERVDA